MGLREILPSSEVAGEFVDEGVSGTKTPVELIGRPKGATLDETRKAADWAGAQRAGLSLDGREEARPQDRVHEDRGWRSGLPDQEVGTPDRGPG